MKEHKQTFGCSVITNLTKSTLHSLINKYMKVCLAQPFECATLPRAATAQGKHQFPATGANLLFLH